MDVESIKVTIKGCARCGGDHDQLEFKPLTRPSEQWTHWAKCPYVGEPIMLKIELLCLVSGK